jgi:ribosomal protein S20
MDRMARKGLFHPNTIARYKSRISAQIKALAD